jgi:hypothetical protein
MIESVCFSSEFFLIFLVNYKVSNQLKVTALALSTLICLLSTFSIFHTWFEDHLA